MGRNVRLHERSCELDARFGILDFSLKVKTRDCKDIDQAFFGARKSSQTWTNIKDGNTMLIELNQDEDNRIQEVTILRQGMPRLLPISPEAFHTEKRSQMPREYDQ